MGREHALLAPVILAGCGVVLGAGFAVPVLGEESRAAVIEEIVVTARRREESIQSVPIAVTALDSRALEFSGIEEVEDLELGVPGLQVSTGTFRKSTPALSIRGLSGGGLQLSEDPSIGYYFAEAPINSPVGQNQAFYDIENVQVLKGPQGTLFGRNSLGGAILVEPRRPEDTFGGYVKAAGGDYDLFRVEGALNVPLSDTVRARLAGQRISRDGFNENLISGVEFDDADSWSWRASLEWDINDSLSTYFVYDHVETDEVGNAVILESAGLGTDGIMPDPDIVDVTFFPALDCGLIGQPQPFCDALHVIGVAAVPGYQSTLSDLAAAQRERGYDEFEAEFGDFNAINTPPHDEIENWGITNQTTWAISDDVLLKNIIAYRDTNYSLYEDIDGSALNVLNTRNPFHAEQLSEELQLQVTSGPVDWIVGLYYFENDGYDDSTPFEVLGFLFPPVAAPLALRQNAATVDNSSYAVFGQLDYHITDALTLTAGLRYTWDEREVVLDNRISTNAPLDTCLFNNQIVGTDGPCELRADDKWDAPSYNLSLSYQAREDLLVYLAHRRSYRTGAFSVRGTDTVEIGPWGEETVHDVEVGLKTDFVLAGMPARVNVAGYHMWWDDLQVSIPKINTRGLLVNVAENQGSATTWGAEFEGTIFLTPDLEVVGTLSWIEGEFGNDFPGQTINDALGVPLLRYDFAGNKFSGGRAGSVPGTTYSIGAAYNASWLPDELGQFLLTVNWYWQEDTWDIKGLYNAPSYGLLNVRADLTNVAQMPVDVALIVRNALDKEYSAGDFATNIDSLGFNSEIPGDPRVWALAVSYRFE